MTRHILLVLTILLGATLVACGIDAITKAAAEVSAGSAASIPPPPPEARSEPLPAPPTVAAPVHVDETRVVRDVAWPVWFGIGLATFALVLGSLGKRVPWLAWLSRGYWATTIGVVGAAGGAVYEAAIAGGPNVTLGAVALAALLTFYRAERGGPSLAPRPRDSEIGSAAHPVLLMLAGGVFLLAVGMAATSTSCSSAQRVRDAAVDVAVDCTGATVRSHLDQYGSLLEKAVRDALRSDGTVDGDALRDAAKGLAIETGGCVLVQVVARVLGALPHYRATAEAYDPATRLREAWEAIRAEQFGGRRFRVDGGEVL